MPRYLIIDGGEEMKHFYEQTRTAFIPEYDIECLVDEVVEALSDGESPYNNLLTLVEETRKRYRVLLSETTLEKVLHALKRLGCMLAEQIETLQPYTPEKMLAYRFYHLVGNDLVFTYADRWRR